MNCKCADDEAYIQVVDSIREPILSLLSRSNTSPEIFFERNKLCLLSSVLLKDADISQRLIDMAAMQSKKHGDAKKQLEHIACISKENNTEYAVIKGLSFEQCIYGNTYLRDVGDIDLLVDRQQADRLHTVLLEDGYIQRTGPTSFQGRQGKALAAILASSDMVDKSCSRYPIQRHKDNNQFAPYIKKGCLTVEVHYGLYGLPMSFLRRVLKSAQLSPLNSIDDPAINLVILLASTYENSESFFSNAFDYGVVVRDYVDLALFFVRYSMALNENAAEELINAVGLTYKAGVVLGNLELLFGKDARFGCLSNVESKPSAWNESIIKRITSEVKAKQSAIQGFRKSLDKIALPAFMSDNKLVCEAKYNSNIYFSVSPSTTKTVLQWFIPAKDFSDTTLYQVSFYPLDYDESTFAYRVVLAIVDEKPCAFIRASNRLFQEGAIRKLDGRSLSVNIRKTSKGILQIAINLDRRSSELLMMKVANRKLIFSAEVCDKQSGDVYWKRNPSSTFILEDVRIGQVFQLLSFGRIFALQSKSGVISVGFEDSFLACLFLEAFPCVQEGVCADANSVLSVWTTGSNGSYEVHTSSGYISGKLDANNALRIVAQIITDNALMLAKGNVLACHAASVRLDNGQVVMLLGSSGSGKTSLAVALSHLEKLALMSDECTLVNIDTAEAWCEDLPFLIKEVNCDILELLASIPAMRVAGGAHGSARYYARKYVGGDKNTVIPGRLVCIIFPEYSTLSETNFYSIPFSGLVESLLTSVQGEGSPSVILRMFIKMISGFKIPLIGLKYGNVQDAAKDVRDFLQKGHCHAN